MHAGFAESLQVYLQQPCAQPAISLALLYCTVLSFGLLSTAYLKHLGLSEALVSVARGAGAVSGLLATVAYPRLRGCLGLDGAGAASIVMQWVCLALAVVPQIWTVLFRQAPLPSLLTSSMLIGGLVASRFGLWAFDLAVSQTMQEQVPNEILGQVNGVQGALQQGGELTMFLLGVAMPRPEQYPVLMLVSFAFVTLALFVFERWALFGSDKEQRALRGMQYQRLESA